MLLRQSYIGLTTRQLKKMVREHTPACIDKFFNSAEKEKKSIKIINVVKISAIAEHLANNQSCAKNYNLERFKITKSCCNVFNFILKSVNANTDYGILSLL